MTTVVNHSSPVVAINYDETVVAINHDEKTAVIISAAQQGPSGPIGPIGPAGGSAITRKAGTVISALVAVYELPDGTVQPLDYRDTDHIDRLVGVTLTSAAAGADIDIQRTGPLDAAGLSLTAGRFWLGINGALTQTPPADGFDVMIGYATAEQRIYLDPQPAITLEE